MDTYDAILARRSIREFSEKEIPAETVEKILNAAILAPSAKNGQPWKFIVITNKEKPAMLRAMLAGIENAENGKSLLPIVDPRMLTGAKQTAKIMEQAPITVFVFNTQSNFMRNEPTVTNQLIDVLNIQSIGAAIENMLLAATDLGIGSLWICDVFFAYEEMCQWLNEKDQMVAAISFGYPGESPNPRPRKKFSEVVEWR